jgi:hypothetical protein
MNPEQRTRVVELLAEGATLREASAITHTPWKAFAAEWAVGRGDSEQGHETELADWYRTAQAARSRKRAVLRALAAETAGTRESGDLLRVLEALEAEDEPEAAEAAGPSPVDSWSPKALALADDLLRELAGQPLAPQV